MAWARFTADFDWPPRAVSHVAYKAGMRCSLPRAGLEAAIAAGAAVEIATPSRALAARLAADPRAAGEDATAPVEDVDGLAPGPEPEAEA